MYLHSVNSKFTTWHQYRCGGYISLNEYKNVTLRMGYSKNDSTVNCILYFAVKEGLNGVTM